MSLTIKDWYPNNELDKLKQVELEPTPAEIIPDVAPVASETPEYPATLNADEAEETVEITENDDKVIEEDTL